MLEIIEHTLLDTIKLLPFLFITYLLMEFLEHKASRKMEKAIKSSGKYGPILGGILGLIPQCGFSIMATNLYMGRILTIGTLISIYLTTSDEMLPILISSKVPAISIVKILAIKFVIGVISGIVIDLVFNKIKDKSKEKEEMQAQHKFCEHEECHCEDGILKSAIKHTISIFIFILIITFILNIFMHLVGEEALSKLMFNNKILGPIIAGLIGLIPNCASSVILTELYVEKIISSAIMISGLLVNAGVGILVLFRVNRNLKENIKITTILYAIGVISGFILELIGLTI